MGGLKLSDALASGRLAEFVTQAEMNGIGPADRSQFDALLGAVTVPPQEGQTSRSPVRGSTREK
jgi:hypothetical protein